MLCPPDPRGWKHTVRASTRAIAAGVSGALMLGAGMAAYGYLGSLDRDGVVERVVDGDTLVVRVAGESRTIGLLNVVAPEIAEASKAQQCLATEAAVWLEERLPAGTSVELRYARELTDVDGRTLAGVFAGGTLVNAELTAAGLGVPAYSATGNRYWPEAEAGFEDARSRQSGLFDATVDCTLPARLSGLASAAESIPTEYVPGVSLDAEAAKVADIASTATALRNGELESLGAEVFAEQTAIIAVAQEKADAAHQLAAASYNSLLASAGDRRESVQPSSGRDEAQSRERRGAREPGPGLEAAPSTGQRFAPAASATETAEDVTAPQPGAAAEREPGPARGQERAAEVRRGNESPAQPKRDEPAPADVVVGSEAIAAHPAKPSTPPGLERAAEVTAEPVVTENRKPATPPGQERAAEVRQSGGRQAERQAPPQHSNAKSAESKKVVEKVEQCVLDEADISGSGNRGKGKGTPADDNARECR